MAVHTDEMAWTAYNRHSFYILLVILGNVLASVYFSTDEQNYDSLTLVNHSCWSKTLFLRRLSDHLPGYPQQNVGRRDAAEESSAGGCQGQANG